MKDAKGYAKGGRKQGTEIHPSSTQKGTGSGNLYTQHAKHVKGTVDKQEKPRK
jgi:hypothetical protein